MEWIFAYQMISILPNQQFTNIDWEMFTNLRFTNLKAIYANKS